MFISFSPKRLFLAAMLVGIALYAAADTASLLVLYTNDIHDYVKPGPNNVGGLPYLAGYVAARRAERGDVLLLDGGDIMEKGDMVAFKTKSRVTYEAIRKMGYAAGAVGNHDKTHGDEHLRECGEIANMALLSLNYLDKAGNQPFPASTVIEVNDITIGVIGMSRIRTSLKEEGERLAQEAKRLDKDVHLLVVTAHIGTMELTQLSAMAPEVDLFVGGHSHEVLQTPVVVPDTNAIIVQAGQYAQYMGHLELAVDRDKKKIVWHDGTTVLMCHDTIAPDTEMLAWIEEQEQLVSPEASEVVGRADTFINSNQMASLAAAALKEYAQVDVAFCHAGRVMRSGVFEGDVDVNVLFRTGGQRGRDLLLFELTGAQIETYIAELIEQRRGRTDWAGFSANVEMDSDTRSWAANSTLEPEKTYRVIMPQREWEDRFQRISRDHPRFQDFDENDMENAPFTFTQALAAYVKTITENGETLNAHIDSLLEARAL